MSQTVVSKMMRAYRDGLKIGPDAIGNYVWSYYNQVWVRVTTLDMHTALDRYRCCQNGKRKRGEQWSGI